MTKKINLPCNGSGVGASVSYSYDGTAIPDGGYSFEYTTTTAKLGNGSGTFKNG
jgi:hypothetical protein